MGRDRGPVAQGVRRSHMLIGQRRSLASVAVALVTTCTLSAQPGSTRWTTPTTQEIDAIFPDIDALYIDLHRNPGARISGDADRGQARRAPEGARVRRHHRRRQDRHRRRAEERRRAHRHAAHRARRAAGRGEDRAAVCQHGRGEERRRPVDAGDARVRARSPHGRVGGHRAADGRASQTAGAARW